MSKFLEIRSKNKDICTLGECGGSITSILQYLLETKVVDGVLNIKKYDDIYDGVPVFITDPKEILETAGSLHCAPTMVADLISEYLDDKKLAVVVKPCDAMAINELVKRNRFNSENLFIIGLNCGGTLMPEPAQRMFELFYDLNPEDIIKEEIDKGQIIVLLKDGTEKGVKIDELEEKGWGRRENCQRCEVKIPRNTDIVCGNWGATEGWTFTEVISEKGVKLINDAVKDGFIESKTPSDKQIEIRAKLEKIMEKLADKFQKKQLNTEYPSIEKWDEYWNRCIECYGCRDVCPICWCNECEIERFFENESLTPPDPLTFQGVRLTHMSFSCINCGQCEDVCPVHIPLSKIYYKAQKNYRENTGYIAGITDELPPLYSPENE
ncbi:MAG: Coenzyme F420 hydrogenase/dehydrogenase, beta subunit C-terminal domain [Methanobrevibacter sp.]|jgi:formate dehydrogenase subunit beta|nr:Coenzyme F420 hydrogenase/dehydrogenase, beta subunit C-terminal domain [Candidatus Methanovirga australis]